nr:uncharacterized protein CI109_001039 [Kwoniella shandongensis]KAA5530859.1 hypothetical protein CI109_001039 [Kwoniella shandongensis]
MSSREQVTNPFAESSSSEKNNGTASTTTTHSTGRNLVILMDGTTNRYSMKNTNVIKTASVLQVDAEQLMYYDSGIGTTLPSAASMWSGIRRRIGVKMDEAFAWNFSEHVQSAYRYLMETYRNGDRIFIFGFSRGSYSARCLAGMIEKVGLLPAGNHSQVSIAYAIYQDPTNIYLPCPDGRRDMHGQPFVTESLAHGYKRTFGISKAVKVHFLGVHDTVASLGLLEVKELPFASNVDMVGFFRQSLALNERRAKFQPVYRHPDIPFAEDDYPYCTEHFLHKLSRFVGNFVHRVKGVFGRLPVQAAPAQNEVGEVRNGGDTCGHGEQEQLRTKEVWFLGCHSDVGGGNDENGQASLSNISFRWMLREAEHCGLKLDASNVLLQHALLVTPVNDYIQQYLPSLLEPIRQLKEHFSQRQIRHLHEQSELRNQISTILTPDKIHTLLDLAAAFDTDEQYFSPAELRAEESDLKRLPKESLTAKWWIVEWFLLQTRNYAGGAGSRGQNGAYSWRINRFRYRRMLPGRLQMIHRSVQRKLQYDFYYRDDPTIDPWTKPKGLFPADRETIWDNLRKGSEEPEGGWED